MKDVLNEVLLKDGFVVVDGIADDDQMISLAGSLGQIVPHRNGAVIQRLKASPAHEASANTLSSRYGLSDFPLHTDTAYLHIPVRFLVLRCQGDTRRRTSIMTFANLFQRCENAAQLTRKSIWRVVGIRQGFYCGLTFAANGERGSRFDRDCMLPANNSAEQIKSAICSISDREFRWIDWIPGRVAIVANWLALHGRGPAPTKEGSRILERIYVR